MQTVLRLLFDALEDAGRGNAVHRIDGGRAPRSEQRLEHHAADERRAKSGIEHLADLVGVVGRDSHREGRENAALGESCDDRRLYGAQVGAAQIALRIFTLAVVLQVDLDAVAVRGDEIEEGILVCQADAVGIDDHARDGEGAERLDRFANLRMHRRLAAAEHDDVEPAVLALDGGPDGVDDLVERQILRRRGAGLGEARGAAQIALRRYVEEIDARVLEVPGTEAVLVSHRYGKDLRRIRIDNFRGHPPLLQIAPEFGRLFVHRPDFAVPAAAEAPQIHAPGALDQMSVADVGRELGIEIVGLGEAARADRAHALEDRVIVDWQFVNHWSDLHEFARKTPKKKRVAKNATRIKIARDVIVLSVRGTP